MTTILLVEDALELSQVIQRELELSGFQVLTAADGQSGLTMFEQHHPDLVVLDRMLPRLDGLEVLRRIRQNSAAPVLILTALSEETDRVVGLEVGADDYMTKPFSMRELIARVRAMLRRAERFQEMLKADRSSDSHSVRWGDLFLDPATRLALLENQELELTRTEFDLLMLFIRNRGRVFSRNYLLESIWDEIYIEGDRSVDNAILRLRKKLGSLGEALETVWGIGYRLRMDL